MNKEQESKGVKRHPIETSKEFREFVMKNLLDFKAYYELSVPFPKKIKEEYFKALETLPNTMGQSVLSLSDKEQLFGSKNGLYLSDSTFKYIYDIDDNYVYLDNSLYTKEETIKLQTNISQQVNKCFELGIIPENSQIPYLIELELFNTESSRYSHSFKAEIPNLDQEFEIEYKVNFQCSSMRWTFEDYELKIVNQAGETKTVTSTENISDTITSLLQEFEKSNNRRL